MTTEERIAQLEEQVAELSARTQEDAPAPSGYYTSRYSGEEIDALLGTAGGGVNLLDNWYLADPIDQRGVSGTISTAGYFIDRWKLVSGSVTMGTDGLVVNGTIAQVLETAPIGAVTACVLTKDGTKPAAYDAGGKTFSFTGSGETVIAAKLELGDRQTLARQDADGGWALIDPPPNKALELLKCQRHQVVYTSNVNNLMLFAGKANTAANRAYFSAIFPVPLRARPALSINDINDFYVYDGTNYVPRSIDINTIDVTPGGVKAVTFSCDTEGLGVKSEAAVYFSLKSGAQIVFDANL